MTTLTKEQIQSLRNQGAGTPQWSDETPTVITADEFVGDLTGNADTATHFQEPSRLTFTGDATGQVNIYGSDASNVAMHVRHSDSADHAEEADRAKSTTRARYADLANLATLSQRATLATKAITSETATHAESSDTATTAERADLSTRALRADQANHATEADHATTATTANRANNATNASHASEADHATSADTATSSARAGLAQIANIAKALDFTIIKVVTSYPETLTADALYVLVDNNGKIIGMDTKDKGPVDFDIMTIDVLTSISESTVLKDGKLYAVPTEDGSGTKLDPRVANVIFKRTVNGVDVYFQVGGSGGAIVLPEASTTQKGIVQLTNSISQDETKAVTPKAVNDLQDTTFVTMSTAQYVYATKDNLDNVAHSLSSAIYQESQRVDSHFVTLSSAQYITGLKHFDTVLPQSNQTPTNNADMTTKIYVDGKVQEEETRADNKFVTLSTAQYISGLKTFTVLPQSSITPTLSSEVSTKGYVDANFVTLGTAQTIQGQKTFANDIIFTNALRILRNDNDKYLIFVAGANSDNCSSITLNGHDRNSGNITLVPRDASNNHSSFRVQADGDIVWDGNSLKFLMSNYSMPASTYSSLTIGASGSSYTAPDDGYVCLVANNATGSTASLLELKNTVNNLESRCLTSFGGYEMAVLLPVCKGHSYTIKYNNVNNLALYYVRTVGALA